MQKNNKIINKNIKNMQNNEYKIKNASISISTAIILPLILALVVLSFDGLFLLNKQTKLEQASTEAAILTSAVKNKKRQELTKDFINAYLPDENIEESEFDENNQTSFTLSSSILSNVLFDKDTSDVQLKAEVLSTKAADIKDTSIAFVLDFSASMSERFDIKELKKTLCSTSHKSYDEIFCRKIIASNGVRLVALQAIIEKMLRMIAAQQNPKASFAIVPFAGAVQGSSAHRFPSSFNAIDYIYQVTLKDEYALDDYEKFSGIFPANCVQHDPDYSFEGNRLKNDAQTPNAKRLFEAIITDDPCRGSLEENINKVIDYEKTMTNMFDLTKAIKFRFFSSHDESYQTPTEHKKPFGNAWVGVDPKIKSFKENYSGITMKAIETPMQKVSKKLPTNVAPSLTQTGYGSYTSMMSGFLRGVASLASAPNKRKVLLIVSDGTDSGVNQQTTELENTFFAKNLCERARQGLKERGAKEVDIFVLNLNDKTQTKDFVARWKTCTKDTVSVGNFDEFFKTFQEMIVGSKEFGNLIYKD